MIDDSGDPKGTTSAIEPPRTHHTAVRRLVWRAIITSSSVGVTHADTFLPADARAAGLVGQLGQGDAEPGGLATDPGPDRGRVLADPGGTVPIPRVASRWRHVVDQVVVKLA